MRVVGRDKVDQIQEENDAVSLCSLYAGNETFGIDTKKIREVLGERDLQRVPMSPPFIAGVVPYRGEVLTTVNLRALLGMEPHAGRCCVLVMEDDEAAERFGLVVDAVGGVVTVSQRALEENPCSAAKLAANPAGGVPASRTCPVATVVIPDGRESDFF